MNKEQAVVYLRFSGFSDEQIKAIEGAFSCDKCVYSTSEGCQYDDITETIPPFETSEDAISRQKMLKYFEGWKNQIKYYHPYAKNFDIPYEEAIQWVKELPPVNPQKPICPSAGVDCEDCPAYEDAISRKTVLDTEYQTIDINGVEYVMLSEVQMKMRKLPPVVTKEERALLHRWRDNRGVSMEEFAKALELLKEGKA